MSKAMSILGSVLFFVAAPVVVAGLVPWWIMRWEFQPAFLGFEVTRVIGVVLIIAGIPGLVDSFARSTPGLGTPAPIAPTQNLVVTGLYRYVRNPIYIALVSVTVGQALLFRRWTPALVRRSGVARIPSLRCAVRRTNTPAKVRNGVRNLSRQRPTLDTAADAMASRMSGRDCLAHASFAACLPAERALIGCCSMDGKGAWQQRFCRALLANYQGLR